MVENFIVSLLLKTDEKKWLSQRPLIDLNGILCKELEANVVIDSWGICNSTLQFIGHVITYPRWD